MPLNEIDSLTRLAGSPALPTAITTRPQLASSPAIAVFTSGEFATDIAIRRAESLVVAPSTMISTRLRAASPARPPDYTLHQLARTLAVPRHLPGEVGEHGVEGFCECLQAGIAGAADFRRAI